MKQLLNYLKARRERRLRIECLELAFSKYSSFNSASEASKFYNWITGHPKRKHQALRLKCLKLAILYRSRAEPDKELEIAQKNYLDFISEPDRSACKS